IRDFHVTGVQTCALPILGLLFSIWAAAVWVLFGLGAKTPYPGRLHADLMIGGFLFLFSAGFLMTAVPRFTGAMNVTRIELGVGRSEERRVGKDCGYRRAG